MEISIGRHQDGKSSKLKFIIVDARKASEWEILKINLLLYCLCPGTVGSFMYPVAVHINCPEGAGGTNIFACAASYAGILVNLGDGQFPDIRHHVACAGGAMLGAGATGGIIGIDHTVLHFELYHSYLGNMFLVACKRQYSTGGANLSAGSAVEITESGMKIHARLKKPAYTIFKQ
jgi:hypothetical protein